VKGRMKAAVSPSTAPIDQARRLDIERSYGGTLGTLRAQVGDVLRVLESASLLFGELAISSRSVPPHPVPVAVRWLYEISLISTRDRETPENANKMRGGWDSNPRRACALSGFQDRRIRPLCHPSDAATMRLFGPLAHRRKTIDAN